MATETAFELDTEAAGYSGGEAVHFGDFPGVWFPGRPVAATELGFESVDAAAERIVELGLPLRTVKVDLGSAPMPARPNHLLSTDQESALERELDEAPRRPSHKELDQIAADAGVSFPDDVKTVDAKLAFLEEQRTDTGTEGEV